MYDVYYTTAGGPWFNSGADIWVTKWIEEVAPHLEVKPLLLFHRKKPNNYEEFPIHIDHIWETSEDEIINSFKQKTRYNIRLAERKGVKIELRDMDDDGVDLMYSLMQATQKRAGFFLRQKDYFANYWKALANAGMGQLIVATHEGDVLGGVFVTIFGEKAYYKDGGSFETKRNLMAPYLLQWEAIKWAKSKGALSYDMVAVPPKSELENENHLQHGLYLFKRGFNEEVTEFVGCWDLPINQNKFRIWKGQESNFLKLYAKMKKNLFW